jgi:hypothetical protein
VAPLKVAEPTCGLRPLAASFPDWPLIIRSCSNAADISAFKATITSVRDAGSSLVEVVELHLVMVLAFLIPEIGDFWVSEHPVKTKIGVISKNVV